MATDLHYQKLTAELDNGVIRMMSGGIRLHARALDLTIPYAAIFGQG